MKKFLLSLFCSLIAFASIQAEGAWTLVTDASSLAVDDQIVIVASGYNYALSTTQKSNNRDRAEVIKKGDNVTFGNDVQIITLKNGITNGTFAFYTGDAGYLYAASSGYNYLKTKATLDANGSWKVEITAEGVATIKAQGANTRNWLQYYQTSTNALFACYASGQKDVSIYKYTVNDSGETPVKPSAPTLTASCNFDNSMTVEITNIEEGAKVYYTIDNSDPAENGTEYSTPFDITETTTVKAIAVNEAGCSDVVSAKYTKNVTEEPETPTEQEVTDILNRDFTGVTGSHYKEWTGKTAPSTSVYAGNTAGGNDAIQLRSSEHSGIITTKSGGKAKKIVIEWNENTDAGRILWIFGKNTPYTTTDELYKTATRGDKLAELPYGTTEFTLTSDYKYIGLRSNSGAMYLNSIKIIWEEDESTSQPYTLNVTAAGWATLYLGYNAIIPTGVEAYAISEVQNDWAKLSPVEGIIPANEGVIIKANAGAYDFIQTTETASIEANLLKGTLTDKDIQGEAYVLGIVDGEVGLYKALMNGTAWKNNANKAYLPASALPATANSAAFYGIIWGDDDEENTTAIENVETATVNVIYDLSGRRVETITAPGIYVVNGRKMLVK